MTIFRRKLIGLLALTSFAFGVSAYDIEVNGIYYNLDSSGKSATVTYKQYDRGTYSSDCSGDIVIPSSITVDSESYAVTAIEDYAFIDCAQLTGVEFPNTIISIGISSFRNTGLKQVVIPNSVRTIGMGAFSRYGFNLSSVTVGTGIQSVDYGAFGDSPAKVIWLSNTPPKGVWEVNASVCYASSSEYLKSGYLRRFKIYEYLSSMFEVDGIKFVPTDFSQRTCDAVDCAFDNSVENIKLGTTVNYRGIDMTVENINPYCFYGCPFIGSVEIDSPYSIGEYAFYDCGNLSVAKLKCKSIEARAFGYCSNLASLNVKTSYIGGGAFAYSSTADDAVYDIDCDGMIYDLSFSNCKSLVSLRLNCTDIDSYAFENCENLTDAEIEAKSVGVFAFENCVSLSNLKVKAEEGIKDLAFTNCKSLTSVDVDAMSIGYRAFYDSSQNFEASFKLKNVKTIGEEAFYNCSSMKEVLLCEGMESIDKSAFENCSLLESIELPNTVKRLGKSVFSGCLALMAVKIGDGAVELPANAFSYCSSLNEISIPENVMNVDDNVFYNCESLRRVIVEDRERPLTFGKSYNGPSFSGCSLKYVYIGGKINYETSPFYNNESLEEVFISDKETEVGDYEFYGCKGLKTFDMGDGVENIGEYAFSGCSSLEEFSFGTGLKTIGREAFTDCISLIKLTSKSTVPPMCATQALDDINKWNCTLYVPKESLDDYRSASQWKDFLFIIGMASGVDSAISDEDVTVRTDGSRIIIEGTNNDVSAEVYSLDGKCIYKGFGRVIDNIGSGVVIVRAGDRTYKIVK